MAKKLQAKKVVKTEALVAPKQDGKTGNAIAPDGAIENPDLRNLELTLQDGKRFLDQKAAILNNHIEQEYQQHVQERTDYFSVHVKEELSRVPKAFRESRNFVQEGESIQAKVLANTRIQIEETFNKSNVPTGPLLRTTG